jgi:hypothetical protein
VPQSSPLLRKRWLLITCVFILLFLLASGFLYFRARHSEETIRQLISHTLAERLRGDVELGAIRVKLFPLIAVTGEDLTIRYRSRADMPPLIHVEHFFFSVGIFGLLRPVKRISLVQVDRMTVTIPPREAKKDHPPPPAPPHDMKDLLDIVADQVICKDTDIVILSKKAGKEPLDWNIHELVLDSVSAEEPFVFRGYLNNGKPKGEIETHGEFGPWDAEDPGGSPLSGEFKFTDADLDPFPGIGGTLSSAGKYTGMLSEIQVQGQTNTPDFTLDKVGKPVPLYTEYSATVDGTNGDTYLHPVNAILVRSPIFAEGSVVQVPGKKGHLITIDASVPKGRIQDILSLAINSDKPLMTGLVKIKAKLILPPGKEDALEKMILDGNFGVDDAKWSSPAIREQLESLSRRGQGKPEDEDVGSSVSDLKGSFHLENGVIHLSSLSFTVPGAVIDLTGTYAVRSGALDFNGHLRLQAKLSQTMTGAKSFFLKAFDPFFKKGSTGAVIPVSITGTRDDPTFGVSVFHKTINKQVGSDNHKQADKSPPKE